jgi:hypothetical protein
MKKKTSIVGLLGATALTSGIYKLIKKIYEGSSFLDKYVDKLDSITPDSKFEIEEDGYYAITKTVDKPIKVLQLTDLHIGGGYLSRHEDMQALRIVYRTIQSTRPDFIVLTGDIACAKAHISMSRNNKNCFRIVTDMLEKIGIPYAITFGNHDADGKVPYKRRELSEYIMSREHSVMVVNEKTKLITGFSNYLVKLRNYDGNLNSVAFMLDSNEYVKFNNKKIYDCIHSDQVEWYAEETKRINKEEGRNVPSHMFFHIPIKEYNEAWNMVTKADKSALYYYGSKNEDISSSKLDSPLFKKVLELNSTKALYCGHDHLNDFSVSYKGVRFTYGQSIDCLLYAKNLSEHKGATFIKINQDGNFKIKGKKHR